MAQDVEKAALRVALGQGAQDRRGHGVDREIQAKKCGRPFVTQPGWPRGQRGITAPAIPTFRR